MEVICVAGFTTKPQWRGTQIHEQLLESLGVLRSMTRSTNAILAGKTI
jgi:hypothetical protein